MFTSEDVNVAFFHFLTVFLVIICITVLKYGKKVRKIESEKFLPMKMITELRQKSQITIPKGIVSKLNLQEGDNLEIYEKDGEIRIVPVAVYPVSYIEGLKQEIERLRRGSK